MVKVKSKEDKIIDTIIYILMAIVLIITLYPLYFVVIASISEPNLVNTGRVILYPKGITFDGYKKVFNNTEIWIGYRNTIFYTVAGTLINLVVTIPAAYALANKRTYGKGFFSILILVTMFFSGGMIPTYILVGNLHMMNTIWALLLTGAASAYNVIVARTYFSTSIPPELEEAATIDGCNTFTTFFKIVLPLSAQIIAVIALFYGVGHWNSYFNAMIYLSDRNKFPLQVFLREILIVNQMMSTSNTFSTEEAMAMADQARAAELVKYVILIVATLPVMFIYPFLQKYFVKGVMVGSVKG